MPDVQWNKEFNFDLFLWMPFEIENKYYESLFEITTLLSTGKRENTHVDSCLLCPTDFLLIAQMNNREH